MPILSGMPEDVKRGTLTVAGEGHLINPTFGQPAPQGEAFGNAALGPSRGDAFYSFGINAIALARAGAFQPSGTPSRKSRPVGMRRKSGLSLSSQKLTSRGASLTSTSNQPSGTMGRIAPRVRISLA